MKVKCDYVNELNKYMYFKEEFKFIFIAMVKQVKKKKYVRKVLIF